MGAPAAMPPFGYGYPFPPMMPGAIPPGLFGSPLFPPLLPPHGAAALSVPKPGKGKREPASSSKKEVASKAFSKACASKVTSAAVDENTFDSVVLRRMPRRYTRENIVKLLDQQGFAKRYRLVYC